MSRIDDFQKKFVSSVRKLGYKVKFDDAGLCFIFKEGFWGWIEFKKSKNARKRPGQQQNIDWANENSWGSFVYPENVDEIKKYLKEISK